MTETKIEQKKYAEDGTRLPRLNTDLILRLIWWAEQDEAHIQDIENFVGTWSQGSWSTANGNDLLHAYEKLKIDILDEENLADAIRNGVCGTSYCMAGQTVVQAGYRIIYDLGNEREIYELKDDETEASQCIAQQPTNKVDAKGRVIWQDIPNARPVPISEQATEILGLTEYEADAFFSGSNRIDSLKAMANGMFYERGLDLPFPTHDMYRVHEAE
jgi:hypothetical protein